MTGNEWLAISLVLGGLFVSVIAIRLLAKRFEFSSEAARKSIHVIMGVACCAFPWIFDRPLPVWILCLLAIIPIACLRFITPLRNAFGSVLYGINRPSYGEILFAPAVATVFHLSGENKILHLVPILILTLADAAGAIAGTRWGKHSYSSGNGFKSIEGSAGFLIVAFISIIIPLTYMDSIGFSQALWIALILATLAMMAEAFSDRGFDNIILPMSCFFLLERLMHQEIPSLVGRFIVLILLLILVLTGSRWSSLSGAALLASAMLGYGCAVLADWRYAIPPSAIFICHLFTSHKRGLNQILEHRLDVVISHAIAAMPWVLACTMEIISPDIGLIGISFSMATQLAQLDHSTRRNIDHKTQPLRSVLKGFLIAALPGLVWLIPVWGQPLMLLPLAIMATFIALPISTMANKFLCNKTQTAFWFFKGALSLIASLPTLLLIP